MEYSTTRSIRMFVAPPVLVDTIHIFAFVQQPKTAALTREQQITKTTKEIEES